MSFTIGVVPIEPNRTTCGEVVLILAIVRLRSVPPDVEPSIVKRLTPFVLIKAVEAAAPEISLAVVSGLSVTVNGAAKALSATGPVSTVRSLVILIVTFPVTPALLSASKMPPGLVSEV